MKTLIRKTLTLAAAVFGLQIVIATTAQAAVPSGTKTITYASLPGVTTEDSGIYDYIRGAFNEGGTLELSLTMSYNGNNCGAYQCIFHAGAKDTGFSLYENGGPNLILSTKNQTSSTYEISTGLTAGDYTVVVRFANNGTDSAAVKVTVDGTDYDRGTWTLASMSWSSTAAERNKYSMGCQAPGYGTVHTLQTTTILDNTITATYTALEGAARIGSTGYETVAAAFAAVQDGQTVALLAACAETLTAPAKTFTLDLGGFAMSGSLATVNNSNITLVYSSNSFTSSVTGGGTIVLPNNTLPTDAFKTSLVNANWTGTLWIKNKTDWGSWDFENYGNANSKIKVTGVTGYSPNDNTGNKGFDGALILADEGNTKALTVNNSYVSQYYFAKLAGDGSFVSSGSQTSLAKYRFRGASDFTGTITLSNATRPVTIGNGSGQAEDGCILIEAGATATMPSAKRWTVSSGKKLTVNGTLVMTTTGDKSEADTDYSYVNGTGTLKYQGTGYRTLSNAAEKRPATTLQIWNEQVGGLIITEQGSTSPITEIGTLSGSCRFRTDWNSDSRSLRVIQAHNSAWSGYIDNNRFDTLYVRGADGATEKTLTLSCTTAPNSEALNIEAAGDGYTAGSVNLTGTWKGPTTVYGEIAGSGTADGNITFNDEATIIATSDTPLTVTGTIAFGENTKVRVAAIPVTDVKVIDKSDTTAGDIATAVTVYVGDSATAVTGVGTFALKYKDDGVYLVRTPETPETLAEMYYNRLSTGSEKVPAGTYGLIVVPGDGYKATAYTAKTTLSNTAAAPEIGGSYASIIRKPSGDTDTATHTFAGWFKVSELPTGNATKMLYHARSQGTDANDNGYMVAVTSTGAIKVGKTHKQAFADGLVSSATPVEADTWFHLAVSVTKTSDARTATPVVYVNGVPVPMPSGTFATNLGGDNCSGVDIGADVSAAGIYVDSVAFTKAATAAAVATNATKYVKQDYSTVLGTRCALWNRDFATTSVKGDYTQTANTADVAVNANHCVTTTSGGNMGHGAKISWDKGDTTAFNGKDMTVLVRYSGFSQGNARTSLFSAIWGDTKTSSETTVVRMGNNTMVLAKNVPDNAVWTESDRVDGTTFAIPTDGLMLVTMSGDALKKTEVSFSALTDSTFGAFARAFTTTNVAYDKPFYGIKVGGTSGKSNQFHRPAMTIEAVVVFEGAYDKDSMPLESFLESFDTAPVNYTATVTESANFSTLTWTPLFGKLGIQCVDSFTLDNTAADATVTFDLGLIVNKLTVTSAAEKNLTLAQASGTAISFGRGYDFSGANGRTTVGYGTGAAAVVAGADTVLTASGTGALTVGAGKKATLNAGATMGSYANNATGTIRYNGDRTAGISAPTAMPSAGLYEFENAKLTGSLQIGMDRKIVVNTGDTIVVDGTGNANARTTLLWDIRGGSVTYPTCTDTWLGGAANYVFTQSGGTFTSGVNSQSQSSTSHGLLLGFSSGAYTMNISGNAQFLVAGSSLNFYQNAAITLTDTALVRAKGVHKTGGNGGTVNIGSGTVFELGALGWKAGSGTFNLNGGTLKSFEDGATFNDAITLGAASTIEVPADQTLTIKSGVTGAYAVTKTGAGTLKTATANLAALSDFTLSAGAIKLVLTPEQVQSATAFDVVATTSAISAFEGRVTAVNAAGLDVPGEISVADGKLKFLPKVDFFTRTVEAGGEITWTDSGWTKGGESGVPCTPGEGRVGDVTVTLMGNATVKLPANTTSLVSVKFVKGQDVESATVTFDLVPPATLPEVGEVKVVAMPFVSPTLDAGITAAYAMSTLDTDTYLAQANGEGMMVVKKSDSISIKFGPRNDTTGKIAATDENIGGYPVAGLFWNHSKNYSDNNNGTTEVFRFKDGNGATVSDAYCFYYAPNTYVNGNAQTTGNGKLTKSYLDDTVRATPGSWPYAVTDSTLGTFYLPKAPGPTHFNMGWEVGITNIPYQVFDLYVYHASDQTTTITLLPMAVKANDGEWKYFKGDTAGSVPCQASETWSGAPYCDAASMVEGVNYVRYRLSADALGLPEGTKIEQVFISHPSRSDVTGRLGLAGIQIVKVANTGVYKRKADPVSSTNWTAAETWISGGASATWENPEGAEVAYAQIDADNVAKVTVDNAITSTLVTVTSAATSNFTLDGAGELTGPFDLTGFWGVFTLSARYDGEVSPAGGRLTLDNAQNNITFATTVSNVTLSAGTLKLTSASQMTADSVLAIAGGTFDMNGLAFTRAFALSGGSLVNNGNNIASTAAQMNGLELTGDASVGGTGNFGLIASQYGASTLTLGNHTLTKTGENSFWLCNTTITGAGTIQVDAGTLAVDSGTAKNSTFADGTISVGASGALLIAQDRTLTVKNVTLAAANGVTATGVLKVTGALDATAAGATIGKLTFDGTPTVKLAAEPLAITTLGFGTDATTVNFDFTGAPFEAWATAGVTSTQMVSVASFPMARLGTIAGVESGWYLDITANGLVLTTNGSKESTISDQTDLGNLYVPGTETLKGTGGAIASVLAFAPNAKIVIDPVRTPLKVSAKPVFKTGAKIALASAYAETSLGKLTLISWVGGSLGLDAEGLKALVDAATVKSGVDYTVEETGTDALRQLVLKIGDYDANGTVITISQFGDSITEGILRSGYRGTPNYRIPLMQMLEAKGYKPEARGFRNVMNGTVPGSSDANGVPAPEAYAWHNGISAQRIYTGMTGSALRAGFMESIEAHLEQVGVTDVITLKIGTNDAIGGETAENIFQGYTNLVWKIKNMRPTTQIYLCSPIPNHNSEEADARAKAAAASMKAYIEAGHFGGNVFFVDGYNAVPNEAAYYLSDGVHPNWNGHMKLAERFCTDITAQFTPSSPHAIDSYTAKTTRTAETNVPETYRNGYVKLLTFTNVVDKATAWTGGVPYTYTNTAYAAKKFDRIAYYVESKTKASLDTRFVWVDMDAAEVGRSVADFCIPTNVQKNVLAKNLHVYSNSSAIENVAPTVQGVNGTVMLTDKGCSDAGSVSGAPASVFGLDWNDTLGNSEWGIMTVSRAFGGVTRTDHRIATEAQILFNFNGYNLGSHGNSLGIGDFAVHCKQNAGNSEQSTKTLNWIFASDNISSMNADRLDYGVVEIWGKMGPATSDVSAEITDATPNWADLVWTDVNNDSFTGLTGALHYTLTGAGKTVALAQALADGATVTLSSGTLNLADGASIGATSTFSIAEGATLGVSTTDVVLKASKVTNNGTVAFNGGTAQNPIEITGDADFGVTTLAANTHVHNTATANRKHLVTGAGPTSYYYLDGHGFSNDTSLNNLTLVSLGTGNGLWIERGIGTDVGLLVPEGKVATIGNDSTKYEPAFASVVAAGNIQFRGGSTLTVGGTSSFSGTCPGAMTVLSGASAAFAGSALPSGIANAGAVTFDYGADTTKTVVLSGAGSVGVDSGLVILNGYRGFVTLGDGAKVGYLATVNDMGSFTPPQGMDAAKIELYKADGTTLIETQVQDGKLVFGWEYTGKMCWWDYEFDEAGTTTTAGPTGTGVDTTQMTFDGDRPDTVKGKEYVTNAITGEISIRVPARPWRDVSSWKDTMTFMFYGKMVGTVNTYQICFGSLHDQKTPKAQLFVATMGEAGKVGLYYATSKQQANPPTLLCEMTVANATDANHLYAFVLKTNNEGKTVVDTYLDGELLQPYTHTGKIALGPGFQLSSGHGGNAYGFTSAAADDPATIDWLRVYDTELTAATMERLAEIYSYTSTRGKAMRTVDSSADTAWVETGKWTQRAFDESETKQDAPNADTEVELTANDNTTLEVNLEAETSYESMKIRGNGKLTLTKGDIALNVPGKTTVDADVTVDYDAVTFGNVTVSAGKTLTFDLSNLDLATYYHDASIKLTGTAILEDGAAVTTNNLTAVTGRTAALVVENSQYKLNVAVDQTAPFIYTVAQDGSGVWTWHGLEIQETVLDGFSSGTIRKAGPGRGAIAQHAGFTYEVEAGTLVLGEGDYGTITLLDANAHLDVGTRRTVSVAGSGKVDIKLTGGDDGEYKYGNTVDPAFVPAAESTAEVGKVYKPNGDEIVEPGRLTRVGNTVKINLHPTVFTVTSITPVAQTNFNGSAVTVAYSNFEKGDYETVTFKLTVGGENFFVDAPAGQSGTLTFHVSDTAAAASNLCHAVVSVVGSNPTQTAVAGKETSTAYSNTAWLYQGAPIAGTPVGWFSTDAEHVNPAQGGAWSMPNPPVDQGKIVFDEDEQSETYLDYTFEPTAPQPGQATVVDMDISFDAARDEATNVTGAQAAIRVVTDGTDATKYRFAAVANGVWATNTAMYAALGTSYALRLTLDYRSVPATVAYEVKDGDVYKTIASGDSGTTKSALESVTFNGTGKLGIMVGSNLVDSVDASLVVAGDNTKFGNVDQALASGKSGLTLLWDASWDPSAMRAGTWTITANGHKLYTTTDGVKIDFNGTSYTVTGDYWEVANLLFGATSVTTNKFMYFTNALALAKSEDNESYTNFYLLRDVTLPANVKVWRNTWFNGEDRILDGEALAFDEGKTFTIEGGCIGIAPTAAGTLLKGGRFNNTTKASWTDIATAGGFAFAALATPVREGYGWQLMPTAVAPTKDTEQVLPVTDANGESVSVVVDKSWAQTVTGEEPDPAKQSEKFSTKQGNGLTYLDNAILGLTNSVGLADAGNIPVIQPHQSSNASKVTFSLGNVSQKSISDSGARVKYRVYKSSTPGGKDGGSVEAASPSATVEMPLPSSGVQYYIIEVDTGAVK